MNTQPDFEDFLRLLEVHRVDSMIGGGYAVARGHGGGFAVARGHGGGFRL